MKRLGWIALALVFSLLSTLLVAWPDLLELRRGKNWNVTRIEGASGELAGVTVSVDQARVMVLPELPDRAVLYLRMGLQGDAQRMRDWLACDLGLTDDQGRVWRPLMNVVGLQVIDLLGDEGDTDNSCDQSRILAPEDGSPSMSVQAFLVPVDVLGKLRLRISGMTTRPDALSLPIRPVLRPPPE
ncbi:hypothetical protein [Paracoccus lutimaris]|uniref:Uncharacterized protein n=1 Tax=Paracoccus lutimaris TaxID=1490030 RepID=A0A368Z311_9RHOB|nr:hypothetical protein [Paracoccus lutimaris]RCW86801.1 hypothetical protein DFP89_104188 [Paracoccus lutimaris]